MHCIRAHILIPVLTLFDSSPLRNRAFVVYIAQTTAIAERTIADTCYTIRYRYTAQTMARVECNIADNVHAIR